MINFNKKQKKFIIAITSFVLIFAVFIIFCYCYANGHNDVLSSNKSTDTYNDTVTIDNTSTDSITTSSDAEPNKGDLTNETTDNNTSDNKNTNDEKENDSSNGGTINSNNSVSPSTNNENSNVDNNENVIISTEKDIPNNTTTNENYKFIINIQIKNVNSVFLSGTVKSNKSLTAFEALEIFAEESNFEIKKSGSGSFAYVTSIDGLAEKGNGPSSGWMYKVNGAFPSTAAGKYALNSGDTLEWIYTHDGGKDVGSR